MAEIKAVSPALVREFLAYDGETGLFMWKSRAREHFTTQRAYSVWNARYAGGAAMAVLHSRGYLAGNIFKVSILAHRAAWAHYFGEWPKNIIDHINGDKTDNRIANLRDVTYSLNNRNVRPKLGKESKYVGVFPANSKNGAWVASICVDAKKIHLGTFHSEDCAGRAYDAAVRSLALHTRTNFPE